MNKLMLIVLFIGMLPPVVRSEERAVRQFASDDFDQAIFTSEPNPPPFGGETPPLPVVTGYYLISIGNIDAVLNIHDRQPGTVHLLTIDNPPLDADSFAVAGQVGYQNIFGEAYLELWSHFSDGSQFFTRTRAESGPLMKLSGTSAMREFRLPFQSKPGCRPSKLVLNLVMPGPGQITLRNVALFETVSANAVAPAAASTSPRALTWLNENFAVTFAILIGFSGLLAFPMRWLVKRGKGRSLVMGIFGFIALVGIIQLFVAAIAFGANKSPDVWVSLIGCGVISTIVPLLVMQDIRKQYKRFELRKLQAMDFT